MKFRNRAPEAEKIELQMTPMIDIVFQLLVFFIMTFKIVAQEGDFNIKMPLAAPSEGPVDDTIPPLKVRLTAHESGELAGVAFNDNVLGGVSPTEKFDSLHMEVLRLVGDDVMHDSADDVEVEFTCDFDLHYRYVIQAITAVSGRISKEGNVVKLIEKIRFAQPPQRPSGG